MSDAPVKIEAWPTDPPPPKVRESRGQRLPIHARILIVARDDERAGPLAEGLDRLGWRTITARGPFAAIAALGDLEIEAAFVDLVGAGREALTFAKRLKAACAPRRLPVIAIADPDPGSWRPTAST